MIDVSEGSDPLNPSALSPTDLAALRATYGADGPHAATQQPQIAFLGLGGGQPATQPVIRNGEPVGADGYTPSEREYMRGAGVDPNAKATAPAPMPVSQPVPGAGTNIPAGLATRKRQMQEDLDAISRGEDLTPKKKKGN
jgi:hypothetical protein